MIVLGGYTEDILPCMETAMSCFGACMIERRLLLLLLLFRLVRWLSKSDNSCAISAVVVLGSTRWKRRPYTPYMTPI